MLFAADADGLKRDMADFLSLADSNGLKIGFVFFDDCWNMNGANLSAPCVPRNEKLRLRSFSGLSPEFPTFGDRTPDPPPPCGFGLILFLRIRGTGFTRNLEMLKGLHFLHIINE